MFCFIFCLCFVGWVLWSFCIVEVVVYGCVFVIIVDNIFFLYLYVIDWIGILLSVCEYDVFKFDKIFFNVVVMNLFII